jgi:hypothetical protein
MVRVVCGQKGESPRREQRKKRGKDAPAKSKTWMSANNAPLMSYPPATTSLLSTRVDKWSVRGAGGDPVQIVFFHYVVAKVYTQISFNRLKALVLPKMIQSERYWFAE